MLKSQLNQVKKDLQDNHHKQELDNKKFSSDKKHWNENLDQLRSKLSVLAKIENQNIKLQQDNLELEKENAKLRKMEKQFRQEYLQRFKEIHRENVQQLTKKNKVIEQQQKRNISQQQANLALGNQLVATSVILEKSASGYLDRSVMQDGTSRQGTSRGRLEGQET